MNSVTENAIKSYTYDFVDNTSISTEFAEIDISDTIDKNTDTTSIKISDTNSKMKFFKTKQDILNLYRKFGERQSRILKELNERKEGYTIIDFKLKLISDTKAIELLTQMRLIADNNWKSNL